jgi:Flp pilus assembly protein TadB
MSERNEDWEGGPELMRLKQEAAEARDMVYWSALAFMETLCGVFLLVLVSLHLLGSTWLIPAVIFAVAGAAWAALLALGARRKRRRQP